VYRALEAAAGDAAAARLSAVAEIGFALFAWHAILYLYRWGARAL